MLKLLRDITIERPLVLEEGLSDYKLSESNRDRLSMTLGKMGYGFNRFTSYGITDKAKENKPANYAVIPNQYFIFASKMYEFATELYKYFEIYDSLRANAKILVGNEADIINAIESSTDMLEKFEDKADIVLFAKFLDKDNSEYRLGSKRLINDDGVPRGSRDCFGSVILKEINLPDASSSIFGRLVYDLCANLDVYSELHNYYENNALIIPTIVTPFSQNKLPKPFLLLAGISGTGKTRFVRKQAEASNDGKEDNYCLVPVRPDWHEPSDLLGYVSRLGNKPEYVATDVLRFIVQAWKEVIDEIEFDKGLPFDWRGKSLNDIRPFWLCLDEMNLAPVEQYFSDYLSILETRCWNDPKTLEGSDRDYIYECDPLIKGELFRSLDKDIDLSKETKPSDLLAKDLGLDLSKPLEKDIWQYFLKHGIAIPFNLIVAGTVNMDETTHGFSRKVIDRALTFDFGEFFPNDIDAFFESDVKPKTLSYPVHSQATVALFKDIEADKDANKTKVFFKSINGVLKNTPFELAFRAFNELCLSVINFAPKDDLELAAVFDDFLMCKVLPRIEGDEDKLTSNSGDNVLLQLSTTLETQLATIWKTTRPDLLREKQGNLEQALSTHCRSRPKIERMQKQLTNGFTSFWP
uniref:ATPase dynein-related AAA domain-containing protein n=1 Tax=Marinomonas sp. (strain MWYL1) TaxID=400668 RepID=A6W3I9_MARMS